MPTVDLESLCSEFFCHQEAAGLAAPDTGFGVAVINGADTLLNSTFGHRDRARRLPVTGQTRFCTGSLTKAFTATALAHAHTKGSLDLERAVAEVHDGGFTLVDILSHRTGLSANDMLWYRTDISTSAFLAAVRQLTPVPDAFRSRLIYNNCLYGAVGLRFESLVGAPLNRYVAEHLLQPLGMTATSFNASLNDADIATPYVGTDAVSLVDMRCISAAGGLYSNLDDMARWLSAQVRPSSTALATAIERTRSAAIPLMPADAPILSIGFDWLDGPTSYSLGWIRSNWRDDDILVHPGFIDGYSSAIVVLPRLELGVVVLANAHGSPLVGHLARALLEATHRS